MKNYIRMTEYSNFNQQNATAAALLGLVRSFDPIYGVVHNISFGAGDMSKAGYSMSILLCFAHLVLGQVGLRPENDH
jgi:hypothetical protein